MAVIGEEDLVTSLRLAGVSKYRIVDGGGNARETVRDAFAQFTEDVEVGIVVMQEDHAEHVQDLLARQRECKATTPVIVEVPSKSGSKHPDIAAYYKRFIREFIGFDIEI